MHIAFVINVTLDLAEAIHNSIEEDGMDEVSLSLYWFSFSLSFSSTCELWRWICCLWDQYTRPCRDHHCMVNLFL